MKTLNHNQLKDLILSKVKGATFISLKTVTEQKALNTGGKKLPLMEGEIGINPDKIMKKTSIVGLLSGGVVTYQDLVNNRLAKEAKEAGHNKPQLVFESHDRKWGKYLPDTHAVLEYKGMFYLAVYCMTNNKPEVTYTYKGKVIDINDSKFDTWRKPDRDEGSNQGTEKPVVVRDYKFSSIKEITIMGETYKIEG
jgi:hypothetical protein